MPKKIVVTGKIGSGKSCFMKTLQRLNRYDFMSADLDAKSIINDNRKKIDSFVYELYGKNLDYRDLFFKDDVLKKRIESFVHKKLYERYRDLNSERDIFIEIPLYFETIDRARENRFIPDKVIYIDALRNIRHKRLKNDRGMSDSEILDREKYLVQDSFARENSDIIFENNGTINDFNERILKYFVQKN